MTWLAIDWTQVAGFVATIAGAASAFAWIVKHIVRHEMAGLRKDLNGVLDVRIDGRIDTKVDPVARKVDHIDGELGEHIPGYRRAP